MRIVSLAAFAALLTLPAAAFDNSTCKEFLAGTWDGGGQLEIEGKAATVKTHSVYLADGTFTATQSVEMGEGTPVQTRDVKGTWDAKPGAEADACEATVAIEGGPTQTIQLKVLDENTVQGPEGNKSIRAPS